MNFLASLLLLTALTIPTPTLVLKTGKRFAVDGSISVKENIVLFRSGGSLYSVPSEEVDFEATRAAATTVTVTPVDETTKLKVTAAERERLLRNLEQNHAGTPASREQTELASAPVPPSNRSKEDEWSWRTSAREYEENVRRAREQLDLLLRREAELQSQISGFISLGYKPAQFTYNTTMLAFVQEQIPQAELEVRRAERAQAQFLDDARRKGIMPGWLR